MILSVRDYMQSLRGKKCAVIGAGVSNLPLIGLLLDAGNAVTVCDKQPYEKLGESVRALSERGVEWKLGEHYLEGIDADIIFRTPGLHPMHLRAYAEKGCRITSEMELFFQFCPCRTIAVTGSDGKTTTSTVIAELLRAQGYTVHLGGNIGHPLLAEADDMKTEDFAVLELSSFQLHSMECAPDVALVTNISPNHLDVHPDMADYVDAKTNIFRRQGSSARTVFNAKDGYTAELVSLAKAQVKFFSRCDTVENGACSQDGIIYLVHNGQHEELMLTDEIRIPGEHNVENFLAAFAAVDGLVDKEMMRSVARSFSGVAHRIEFLRELRGVRYYNDSIASSPTRTIAGLRSFSEKPILIAGGYDKHIPFDELGIEINERVKALCLNGATAQKIYDAVTKASNYCAQNLPIYMDEDFDASVARAASIAESGDVVLMSPACAAFDQFKNFEKRGDHFRELVLRME